MRKLVFSILKIVTFNYFYKRKQKNSLLILMFHRVNDERSTFYCPMPVDAFRQLCEFIKANYEVIYFSEIRSHFQKTSKPAAIISFDDGHYDIIENALPILSKLGLKFNINIDTEVLDTGKPQDFVRVYDILNHTPIESYMNPAFMQQPIIIDRVNTINTEKQFTNLLSNLPTKQKREVTDDLAAKAGMENKNFARMLNREELKLLSRKNVEFGSHSHSHSFLTKIPAEQINYELKHSKDILEGILDKKIEVLAYPNGQYNGQVEEIAKDTGYKYLLQTGEEINHIKSTNDEYNSYKRVSQYHHTLAEALAHTYGITRIIRKFKN